MRSPGAQVCGYLASELERPQDTRVPTQPPLGSTTSASYSPGAFSTASPPEPDIADFESTAWSDLLQGLGFCHWEATTRSQPVTENEPPSQ